MICSLPYIGRPDKLHAGVGSIWKPEQAKNMALQVTFKPFQVENLADLEPMMLELYREDPDGEPMTRAKIYGTIQELTRHPDKGRIVIFAVGRAVVGYAIIIFFWSNEFGGNILYVDELYVKSDWRNRGIATQFFEHLAGAWPEAARGLKLEVTPSNKRALAYYRRLGFQPSENIHLFRKVE